MSEHSASLSRREWALLGALLVVLIAATAIAQPGRSGHENGPWRPSLSIHSNRDHGARALALWLADLGYRPVAIEYRLFDVDPDVPLLFVLAPTEALTEAHVAAIARWVEQGGTLVVAADRTNALLEHYGVELVRRQDLLGSAVPRQPVFWQAPLRRVEAKAWNTLKLRRPEWTPLLGAPDDGQTVAAVARIGQGRVFALSTTHPLSNSGLRDGDNWALVLHLLADIPPGSAIAFDEYHHGLTEHGTLGARLLREPWGWAVLYTAALLFAYTALRGRRFGRALPANALARIGLEGAPHLAAGVPGSRRTRGEYVATLARLLRHARHRDYLRQQYVAQLKRSLGTRFRVRADLPAREFVAALAAQRPEAKALAGPLERLEQGVTRAEGEIVDLMREADGIRGRLVGK